MTESGRHVWLVQAQPKIRACYERLLENFSTDDVTHALHYLLKLENMKVLDAAWAGPDEGDDE